MDSERKKEFKILRKKLLDKEEKEEIEQGIELLKRIKRDKMLDIQDFYDNKIRTLEAKLRFLK